MNAIHELWNKAFAGPVGLVNELLFACAIGFMLTLLAGR
jgi:hypothetical protein